MRDREPAETNSLPPEEPLGLDLEPRLGHGIHRRFVVAISMLVALVLMTQGAVLLLVGHDILREHMEDEATSFATLAVAPIVDAYDRYHDSGYGKFRQLLDTTAALQPDLVRVELYDMAGRRLFDSRTPDAPGLAASASAAPAEPIAADDPLLAAIRGLEQVTYPVEVSDRESVFRVVQPYVEEWGRHQYSVVFHFSYVRVQDVLAHAGVWLAVIAFFALVLGVGCAYVLSAGSLRPVAALTRHARRLARGELDGRVGLRTGDEFEVLGATLDRMAMLLAGSIDDLETSNRRLEAANRELQELDRLKSDLLANVSHELKTPLTAIRGYVEAMGEGLLGDITPVQKDGLEVVERNIARLRSMIDQLLGFARMDSGRLRVEPRSFDLLPMARHVLEVVRAARGETTRFELVADDDLPEVHGDPARLSQVIENLLTNAAKFSHSEEDEEDAEDDAAETRRTANGERPLVTLRVRGVPTGVEISVRDRGIGIPQDAQERIFDRFFQVDASSRRPFGGMGLGLAIVREIVDQHGSRIEVESTPGEGSTFRFVLPLAGEATGIVPVGEGRRLLLVDDDSVFVQRVASHLGDRGWTVQVAATAEQGTTLAHRTAPDAIVLDRLLPDQDGFDLLTRLREEDALADVPIALCTVRRERALGLRLGADAYWVKPLAPSELEHRLEALLADASRPDEGSDEGSDSLPGESVRGKVDP